MSDTDKMPEKPSEKTGLRKFNNGKEVVGFFDKNSTTGAQALALAAAEFRKRLSKNGPQNLDKKIDNEQEVPTSEVSRETKAFLVNKLEIGKWLEKLKEIYSPLCDSFNLKSSIALFKAYDKTFKYARLDICIGETAIVSYSQPLYSLPIAPPLNELPRNEEYFKRDFLKVHELNQKIINISDWMRGVFGNQNFNVDIEEKRDETGNVYFNICFFFSKDLQLEYSYSGFEDDILLMDFDPPPQNKDELKADMFLKIGEIWLRNASRGSDFKWRMAKTIQKNNDEKVERVLLEMRYQEEDIFYYSVTNGIKEGGSNIVNLPLSENEFLLESNFKLLGIWLKKMQKKESLEKDGRGESFLKNLRLEPRYENLLGREITTINVIWGDKKLFAYSTKKYDAFNEKNIFIMPEDYQGFVLDIESAIKRYFAPNNYSNE